MITNPFEDAFPDHRIAVLCPGPSDHHQCYEVCVLDKDDKLLARTLGEGYEHNAMIYRLKVQMRDGYSDRNSGIRGGDSGVRPDRPVRKLEG